MVDIPDKDLLAPGHRGCAGCGASIAVKLALNALGENTVAISATGCLEVMTTPYPESSWEVPFIHVAFENSGAVASGVESALRIQGKDDVNVVAFGGDGGTVDIGLQSLSGAMERGHNMLYICYDNEAYMNTGTQRSSATPRFASATTTPSGIESVGKKQNQKDLTQIMVAHGSPYVAQTTMIGTFQDFHEKAHKAIYTEGPTFVNVLTPCPRGWQYPPEILPQICKTAVDTCIWPLYEVEEGEYHLTYKPKNKLPVEEFMKLQGRFKHCFAPGNEWTIEEAQKYVDRKWEELLEKCN